MAAGPGGRLLHYLPDYRGYREPAWEGVRPGVWADTSAPFTFLAPWGQRTTQRIQEIHAPLSVSRGSPGRMAWAGYCSTQRPQFTQPIPPFGTNPVPPAFL